MCMAKLHKSDPPDVWARVKTVLLPIQSTAHTAGVLWNGGRETDISFCRSPDPSGRGHIAE